MSAYLIFLRDQFSTCSIQKAANTEQNKKRIQSFQLLRISIPDIIISLLMERKKIATKRNIFFPH
jgi:hypothetical protein